MSAEKTAIGRCLCGAVTITVSGLDDFFGVCHCGMCRKWGGGPMMAIGSQGTVEMRGEDHVSVFASSPWAERGFCRNCGTHLYYRLKGDTDYHFALGLFGDRISPRFSHQIYIDAKPDNYSFADDTEILTEAQVIEMYAPKE